ncbi:hypothetical protein OJF2_19500 [Aquisphaera giovannonii]|uniref:Dockerin domain-containing protein n=1 Tax=Aquisphaera giovannonii TaxID=406548 RepID=A0A5B9VYS3_9BACT|nr:dockerin type I domain-containing protein [Aquisphaera giovannonii]QEH33448.1 hypothetical protein OJF2_19500 [Aquisphaera giovannonii]
MDRVRKASRRRCSFEALETRLALSTTPANVIGEAAGTIARPGAVGRTTAAVSPANLNAHRKSTLFGLFVSPNPGTGLRPRIVAATGAAGHARPIAHGRVYGFRGSATTVAFTTASAPGSLTTETTGAGGTSGGYQAQTTLIGDVNGDGRVDYSDLQAFAPTYMAKAGSANYDAAADFNHNGIINLYDAKVLLRNMAPLTRRVPLNVSMAIAPQFAAHYPTSQISGGATMYRDFEIVGRTTPGSLVIQDNHKARLPGGTQAYKFTGPATAVGADGTFTIRAENSEGLNNNDFLILDPFGGRTIFDFPVLWIPYASGRVGRA